MNKKIVIVGHGLAGSVLAQTLIEHHQDVVVLEAELPHAASQVSAGLINPFIGPKLNIPEDFQSCMEENIRFFEKIRNKSRQRFLESINLYRVFQNLEQKKRWDQQSNAYKAGTISVNECKKFGLISKLGAGKTNGWILKTHQFIAYSKRKLISLGSYLEESFEEKKWKDHRVVFCDGYRAAQSNWFKHLPFAPTQGDVIKIVSKLKINASNGTWHLAEKNTGYATIGSTWKHENIEEGPTSSAQEEIFRKIDFLPGLNESKILHHKSGVRSGTIDRNPILGQHHELPNYYLFNGFGSRGCTTIALSAKEMKDLIIAGRKIPKHKDLRRFL